MIENHSLITTTCTNWILSTKLRFWLINRKPIPYYNHICKSDFAFGLLITIFSKTKTKSCSKQHFIEINKKIALRRMCTLCLCSKRSLDHDGNGYRFASTATENSGVTSFIFMLFIPFKEAEIKFEIYRKTKTTMRTAT